MTSSRDQSKRKEAASRSPPHPSIWRPPRADLRDTGRIAAEALAVSVTVGHDTLRFEKAD